MLLRLAARQNLTPLLHEKEYVNVQPAWKNVSGKIRNMENSISQMFDIIAST